MKSIRAIRNELARVRIGLSKTNLTQMAKDELYGAQQALCWALGENAMAPAKCALANSEKKP